MLGGLQTNYLNWPLKDALTGKRPSVSETDHAIGVAFLPQPVFRLYAVACCIHGKNISLLDLNRQ
jgi:hypothetical protein